MKTFKIKSKEFLLDDEDYEWISDLGAWNLTGQKSQYASLSSHKRYMGQVIYLHRLIMIAEIGHDVIGMDIDHIDRNTFNCQKSNLRLVTEQENTWNRRRIKNKLTSSSKFIGVIRNSSQVKGKKKYWGNTFRVQVGDKYFNGFKTEEDAAKFYDKKVLELRGEFAQLNSPYR